MWYKTLTDRQRLVGGVLLIVGAIGLTGGAFGGYKYLYVPWAAKKKFNEGDGFASYLYENQDRAKSGDVQTVQ